MVAHVASFCWRRDAGHSDEGCADPPGTRVTVGSEGGRVLAEVAAAGDEPFMLARALPGVPVLVGADRFASGSLAERELDVTVHVLDDGFQHVQLARDVDLLMVDDRDLDDCVLPAGRLREPLANAAQADAALVTTENPVHARSVAETLGIGAAFTVRRQVHAARALSGADLAGRKDAPVVAFAGIARPERFFTALTSAGWHVAEPCRSPLIKFSRPMWTNWLSVQKPPAHRCS